MPSNGAVLWRGASLLTGDPVVAVVTGLRRQSRNSKTGDMLQTWILRTDMRPKEAVRTGADDAICGDCPHRSGSNVGRSCYVIWWQAPERVFHALARYPEMSAPDLAGRHVRLGSYGDPAAVPARVWGALISSAAGWTGYTHHWRTCDQGMRGYLMASVDAEAEALEARASGWRTFRVRQGGLMADEVVCPASAEAGHAATCEDCQLCRGTANPARSVAIRPHGQRVKWLTSQ